ncbi:winged helix-turn-helix domain-containing tetratricopeptide repeat protein [Rhodanobacter geophilus]|uniref:Winged helix-turn-helix domain-containing tetratricopeptide repeat protein n=1 Tax=Rhodanobacter geophilus TaxID=3162488 RepID=A0ABV3QS02_9GAMM
MEGEGKLRYVAFDAVEIDLDGRRVSVGGRDVALEPKAFDVLALLVQAPGKAFSRDEILDAVWGHRCVTPGVLNRVVTMVRRALGETANHTRYIHTLHGVGYRFDGAVRRFAQRVAPPENPAAVDGEIGAAPAQALPVSKPDDPPTARPPADGARGRAVGASPAIVPAAPVTRRPAWASPRLRLLAATLLVAVAGTLLWWRTNPAKPAVASPPTLVVLPLRVIGDEGGEHVFADGLSEELATQLARVDGLRLIASVSAARAREQGLDAAQLAERLHVTHAIEGSLRESGAALRIDLRLIETPSGRTVWAQSYDRRMKDVFGVQQDIAQAVASALALHLPLDRVAVRPPDPAVFSEYLRLRHIFLAHPDDADYGKAELALNALAAHAPDFAPVHGLLALNLATHFEPGREQQALPEASRALRIDPDNVYAHAALGELACMRDEWNDCMKELRAALARNPTDPIMNSLVGMHLARLGYGEEALRLFQAGYAMDPLSYWAVANLGTQLDTLGRHAEARPYLDALPGLAGKPDALTDEMRWRNAVWRNDLAGAHAIAAHMPDNYARKPLYAAFSAALADPVLWPQALAKLHAAQQASAAPLVLQLQAPQPDQTMALRFFEQPWMFEGKLLWVREYAAIRQGPAFSGFLHRTKTLAYWNAYGWPPQCRPDGDGARCD